MGGASTIGRLARDLAPRSLGLPQDIQVDRYMPFKEVPNSG